MHIKNIFEQHSYRMVLDISNLLRHIVDDASHITNLLFVKCIGDRIILYSRYHVLLISFNIHYQINCASFNHIQ